MKALLKLVFGVVLIYMIYVVITTSLQSNLYTDWDYLASIPWMRATLWDFYANVLAIFIWVAYKEKNYLSKLLWLVLFVTLGSIATAGYILIQLFKLKKEESVVEVLTKRN